MILIPTKGLTSFWSYFDPETVGQWAGHFTVHALAEEEPSEGPFFQKKNEKLQLVSPSGLTFQLDFSSLNYRRRFSPSSDLLCRACGWHLGLRRVWDLTAGLAVDSVLLSQAGFQVRAIEQNPFLFLLIKHAYWEQQKSAQQSHSTPLRPIDFQWGRAEDFLRTLEGVPLKPEVVYYDPMYPSKNKTALPSKEMQLLRELNGTDGENAELLMLALQSGILRLVVKRPLKAPPILERPQAQIKGKLIRYDIYAAR